ncbi:hypothetical protein [Mycobacterium sp. 852002-51961_SCH5331710]|uniref:hypothetical protein n=1 Tax=Mycobacterium sp. 852002-51961_SCH5331710 TaxID=1834105 RepID=UPI0007FF5503|nr:hypothetical protein [Mycobacterium sp. 852002-51961_SCH5331710]OBB37317.1 hypothetical protein A5752_14895 [Mycobacterium sp. 852002-51961_SCH5331710]
MTEQSDSATNATPIVATGHRPVNQILAWAGVAAAVVFILAVVFFSGFVIGRGIDGGDHQRHWEQMHGNGMMAPGMMTPGMMTPGMTPPRRPAPGN